MERWSPVVQEIIKATPEGRPIDHKLVYRDTFPTIISPKARIALIGDAARPFLRTLIQGTGQALEDAVTLAITTELSGTDRITQAVKAYEEIRYVCKDPKRLHLLREEWLLDFDA